MCHRVTEAWDQPQAHAVPSSGGRCASQGAKMPYAGIAAELTNDGRLRADWRASEGAGYKCRDSDCFGFL